MRDATRDLPHMGTFWDRKENMVGVVIRRLHVENRPVDAVRGKPGRRAGFQTTKRQAHRIQSFRQTDRGLVTHTPAGPRHVADMDDPAQERARSSGQRHEPRTSEPSASTTPSIRSPASRRSATSPSITSRLACVDQRPHGSPVGTACGPIASSARARRVPFGGSDRRNWMPDLSAAIAHHAAKRVDLSHEVALAETPDRRVAGHHADPVPGQRHKGRRRPSPRRGAGRL
jgi:hypothetical protein